MTSGSNPPVSHTAGPGVQIFQVPMGVGSQTFQFEADGKKGSDTPNITISAECWVSDNVAENPSGTQVFL